jgi:membrane associated rhomboid family serine protease
VILLINLAFSVGGSSHISLGGHLGGLAAGVLCAAAIIAGDRGRLGENRKVVEIAIAVAVGILAILGALAIA